MMCACACTEKELTLPSCANFSISRNMFRKIAHRHLQSALRMTLIQPNESRFVPATRAPAKQAGKHQVAATIVFC